jgi:hypothetical protein
VFGWHSDGNLTVRGQVIDAVLRSFKDLSKDVLEVQVQSDNNSQASFFADDRYMTNDHNKFLCLLIGYSTKKTLGGSVLQYVLVLRSLNNDSGFTGE